MNRFQLNDSDEIFDARNALAQDLAELLVANGFEAVVEDREDEPVASFLWGGEYFDVFLRTS